MIICDNCGINNPDFVKKCNGCNQIIGTKESVSGNEMAGFIRVAAIGNESIFVKLMNAATGKMEHSSIILCFRHHDFWVVGQFQFEA